MRHREPDDPRSQRFGIAVGPGGADETCFGTGAANTLSDPAIPAGGFYYVVRANSTCGSSGWGVERIGRAWGQLMQQLGYASYVAQGGDWGAIVTTSIAQTEAAVR